MRSLATQQHEANDVSDLGSGYPCNEWLWRQLGGKYGLNDSSIQ